MNFSAEEWGRKRVGLARAQERLERYRQLPKDQRDPELLDEAVWLVWRFGEYALNALLEAGGERADRGHEMGKVAAEFFGNQTLVRNYQQRLDQLERYRRKADYGAYSRERSVHYNAQNVDDCRVALEQLAEEVEALLVKRGWLLL